MTPYYIYMTPYHKLDKVKPVFQQTSSKRKTRSSRLLNLFSRKTTTKPITKSDIEHPSELMFLYYQKYGIIFTGSPAGSCINSLF
tara:strand:+ start:3776 stop:4030 length:255 start_codon:yes stop_codon:yes gene_type:complete